MKQLNINRIYNNDTIEKILNENNKYKIIYNKPVDYFKFGKEKVKIVNIIEGYETEKVDNVIEHKNNEKITFIICDIVD